MDQQAQAPQLYGVNKPSIRKNLEDKIADLFGPADFVRVINPDDEVFWWQVMDPAKEHINIESPTSKTVIRDLPDLYSIQPGESKVLPGWNARLMIIGLYKKLAAKDSLANHPEGKNVDGKPVDIAFGWDDDIKQDSFINKIFVGIETPRFDSGVSVPEPTGKADVFEPIREPIPVDRSSLSAESQEQVAKDLGLLDEVKNEPSSKVKGK